MRRGVVAVLLLVAFVLQGTTSVLAGTTGAITGSVIDPTSNQPVNGARVTVASPSQSATTTTDASGRFSFISLNPDTYTVSVTATSARDAASVSGVTVQADQTVSVSVQQPTRLKQIGSVTSRAASALVKPGTTADVYSINAVTQDKASALGGGGTLNQAWSAISSVPGVYVAPNQQGYIGAGATISIRGGDYDQIGYELDGVPVNRAFDNYPSGPLSSLGQQELQVYTGAPAANAEANGISGYINQVIRTGTAPASRNLTLAIGTPTFYNKVAFEAGGANPARTFSYYMGAGAYNQSYRYYDNFNGASLQPNWGAPLAPCPPGISRAQAPSCFTSNGTPYTTTYDPAAGACTGYICSYVLGPYTLQAFLSDVKVRDTVANFHFGIPRKDGNRDDVQLLFDNNFISNPYYSSTNDQGGLQYLSDISQGFNSALPPGYFDGYQSSLRPGAVLAPTFTGGSVTQYLFPQSPQGRQWGGFANCSVTNPTTTFGGCIEPDRRDTFNNNQSIVKLQYQKNFGTNAFLRLYGYTYYSDWLQTGPQTNNLNYIGYVPGDYELESHTRGLSLQFADQINTQHLLGFTASYTMATTLRDNNTQFLDNGNSSTFRNVAGILVNGNDPYSGICYTRAGVPAPSTVAGQPAGSCFRGDQARWNPNAGFFTYNQAFGNAVAPPTAATCGTGPCEWLVVGNGGMYATYNTVTPKFTAFALTDQWKPSDKLSIDLGLRYDRFVFQGSDTTTGGQARTFAYNAWNRQFPSLAQFNVSAQTESYSEIEPRLGLTYSLDPRTVIRASYGRYAQAPNSAFEQYNFLAPVAPALLVGFVSKGVGNTPAHAIRPSVANNYDFSLEHQFNRDTSVKLTPFLRKTQDQIQQFYLDQKTNFVSGLNVGRQTSQGFEFELDKGDFSRNGWAGRLTYTYTNSYIQYTRENGLSVLDGFNDAINSYNAFTRTGGGAPCYTPGGAADPTCGAGSVANPYYNAPAQPLLDQNGKYATYSLFPGGIGGAPVTAYGAPHVATLLVQYKRGPLAITPALQFSGGIRYGVPLGNPGVDPSSGCTPFGSTAGDPRYPYGAAGGSSYDASTCGGTLAIPNVYTGRFDNIGAFAAPNNIQLHTQITYDINKRVTLVGNFANIVNNCFGGSKVPWGVNQACGYAVTYGAGAGPTPVGNVFNPGDVVQPFQRAPYDPTFRGFPFNMYFEARIKI